MLLISWYRYLCTVVISFQSYDGGFGLNPGSESHGELNQTYENIHLCRENVVKHSLILIVGPKWLDFSFKLLYPTIMYFSATKFLFWPRSLRGFEFSIRIEMWHFLRAFYCNRKFWCNIFWELFTVTENFDVIFSESFLL